ncbi:MAG: right-handed parallel beta-helix repeat-containing protein [Lachnospiraceae bacterium]|nr:right-handed parallel beta-helix repeat-containing protein [Lachnospiraceae bacterium]
MKKRLYFILLSISFYCFFLALSLPFSPVKAEDAVVSIRSFGAVGDGVTDDSDALRRALEYAGKHAIPLLLESDHVYLAQGEIPLYSNTTVYLNGATITDCYPGGVTDPYVQWGNGLRFINAAETLTASGYGALHDVTISGGTFNGRYFDTVSGVTFALLHGERITLEDLTFEDCMAGTHIIDLGGCKNVVIRDCTFTGAHIAPKEWQYREAIQLDSALYKGMPYWDSALVTIAYDGLACEQITIDGCRFSKGNGTHAMNAIGTHTAYGFFNHDITITGNTFSDCESYAIRFPKAFRVTVTKNRFIQNQSDHAKKDAFLKIYTAKNRLPYLEANSDITIRQNTFSSSSSRRLLPISITGNKQARTHTVSITANTFLGTYKKKTRKKLCTLRYVDPDSFVWKN